MASFCGRRIVEMVWDDLKPSDILSLASFENGELVINTDYANVIGLRRYKEKGKGYYFSPKLIEWLGPKREGDIADEPYIHYAASIQALFPVVKRARAKMVRVDDPSRLNRSQ